MGFIVLVVIALFIVIGWAIYALLKALGSGKFSPKLVILIIGNLFLLSLSIYIAFPLLPSRWADSQSLLTANDLLVCLKKGDYRFAQGLLTDKINTHKDIHSLESPVNRPISWELEITRRNASSRVATGVVSFEDGEDIPVVMIIEWEWQTAAWKVSDIEYNPHSSDLKEHHVTLFSYETDFDVLRDVSIIYLLPVVGIVVSGRYLFTFRKEVNMAT